MIEREQYYMLKALKANGMSITQIAELCDLNRKTVSKWVNSDEAPQYRMKKQRKSKLDDFKSYILARMNEGCSNAVILYEEILEQGYEGKMTILREFMKDHRKQAGIRAMIRYETPPGKQAQVDWGEFMTIDPEGNPCKIYAFVIVMGYSRKMYLEFTKDTRIQTLIGCHERAFRFFGGIPETILYDNMKTVVSYSHKKGLEKWNHVFLSFATFQGFSPVRCRPFNPKCKGKVENGVKYIRRNFWPRIRGSLSLKTLNDEALLWLDTTCNKRMHQTTREVPDQRFKHENLKPPKDQLFASIFIETRKVSPDCFISFNTCRYSVPHTEVGKTVQVRDSHNGSIEIFSSDGRWLATHEKSAGKYGKKTNKKHFEGIRSQTQKKELTTVLILDTTSSPKVHQRPLTVYDSIISEVTP